MLTGDSHLGVFQEAECTSYTGQKILPELTSSGLSHSKGQKWGWIAQPFFEIMCKKGTITSDVFIDLNYGLLQIERADDSN